MNQEVPVQYLNRRTSPLVSRGVADGYIYDPRTGLVQLRPVADTDKPGDVK